MELTIGQRIRTRRTELNISPKQLYSAIGISSGNLSDLENGKKLPSAKALIGLSTILDCSIDWILTGQTISTAPLRERESILLEIFRELPAADQEEIIDIVSIKRNRIQRELQHGKSSPSIDQTDDAKMA